MSETTTIHRLFVDYEKEERWLNEMAARGSNFIGYRWGTYRFVQGTPGEWIYRIQFLEWNAGTPKGREYIEFVESTGAEAVSTYLSWVYFRKRAADGPFELFSDIDSRLAHYRRLLAFHGAMTGALCATIAAGPMTHLIQTAERTIGEYWGLPIFIIYLALAITFGANTMRLIKRIKDLESQRRLAE